ncbi:MinD/ParA family ATP-binding protein [Pseudarthrobacter niigatensis]|uniref:MinD-like ATPase involved in chromosome partitioning or flagellar assembly n=1 Tax=Pseudarthrobacter niigatensis TaxID=369935 RepID=A0AAJ1SRX2_9MICC|nr:MinD/ParA family protein [Pseudarthrobacter niigatensis]MDQ0145987.1 MinD-like ATPase involved in chromosome partitioning or flagellar assembly [Pseudarthrobacter niigatensis]MDQ0266285.1 MinD-like ATPase involved in chromosome partitioning or flagellar assembly [Pseudarthrobacter niigatensis]
MPAVTPETSSSNDAGKPAAGRSSWAEAAAAADAIKPSRAPSVATPHSAAAPAPAQSLPGPIPAAPLPPVSAPDEAVARAPGPAPDAPTGTPAFRRSRPTVADAIAESPLPDFISSPGLFVKEQKPRPTGGIRGALYNLTGGAWNLGPGPRQRHEDELARRISRQLQGSYNTAILSLKGGIGKTSTTVGVGLTLAEYRGDAPCAIDANPDSGDLVERALGEGIYQQSSPRTISDLLANIESIDSLTALARYMHHAGRLHLIAGEQDPEVSDSLTAEEYLRIRSLISSYYSVALTDCGTGVTHNAMSGILQSADNLVIAAGYAVSGAKRARSTLHWLASHGYADLARNAIVVITDKDEVSSRVDKDAIEEHLAGICRELIAVPHDRGVADGDLVTLDVLKPETRRAYKKIAAAIVDGYR